MILAWASPFNVFIEGPGWGGGVLPYVGCAAGRGAFFCLQFWHRVLFELTCLAPALACFFVDFSGPHHPNSITIF